MDVVLKWQAQSQSCVGLLDSGADQTVIPHSVVVALRPRKIDEVEITSANNNTEWHNVYAVDIEFDGIEFVAVPAVETDFDLVLIGRDLLNDLEAMLNGPGLEYRLHRP